MTRRRYRMDKPDFSDYHRRYDDLKGRSPILSPKDSSMMNFLSLEISDKPGVESALFEWRGNNDGVYRSRDGSMVPSRLKMAQVRVDNLKAEFSNHQRRRVNEGRRRPEKMDSKQRRAMFEAEAEFDICQEECDKLTAKLEAIQAIESKVDDKQCLRHGPDGHGKMSPTDDCPSGRLIKVDGQKVDINAEGILCISDERSPYNGMTTADYFEQIVKPWQKANRRIRHAILDEYKNKPNEPLPFIPKAPWPKWEKPIEEQPAAAPKKSTPKKARVKA